MSAILTIVFLILLTILVMVVYLLISPFRVSVDSRMKHYWIGWNRWMNARIAGDNNKWIIVMTLPLWQKKIGIEDLIFRQIQKIGKEKEEKLKKTGTGKKKISLRKFLKMIGQIQIREFRLQMDTGNFIWNAYLTPIVEMIRFHSGYTMRINYMGKNEITVKARCRMINMLLKGIF